MPDTKSEVRHAAKEPVTIDILCRCVTGLLLGGFLGIGLVFLSASFDPRKAPISPVPEVQIGVSIIASVLVSVLAGFVSRGHAAALLSTGTGILLVVLSQSLTVPLNSPLPWTGGAVFMTPGLMLLSRQSWLQDPSSTDDGPDGLRHVKSVVTGIIAGLLLQIPLAGQEIIAQTGTTAFNPYLPVYLLIVAVTMLSFRMVVSKSLATPIVMIATCLPAAWGTKNAMPILLFGVLVLSMTVPLRLKDAR
jgi:membrane protein